MTCYDRLSLFFRGSAPFGLVCLILLSSCSYKLGLKDRRFPGGYEFVSVPVFKNQTQETGAEVYFTNSLIDELERSRLVRISPQKDAQVTLEGTVSSISYTQSSQTAYDATPDSAGNFLPQATVLNTEYYINVSVLLIAKRNSDQKIIWQSKFDSRRPYSAPKLGLASLNASNAPYNNSAHYQNIQAMATDMMAEAHDRLTENF